ncbi:hybrid sensor histidine kinase/response regulator [Paraglaciecola aquimarina]|uniref:histidine kinase n=1 Tax=Paraglaciecola algarum TaxID=3050085 RepID=A0ABS9DEV5_9ALTE|nr:hybrid sensor histidine kinase/response regulator [Paraglaciecola sp. G1-23]MCF2950319.1 hybrid sensor histidine kinase/response regulator [Paraglaciecola sp. G1-23]
MFSILISYLGRLAAFLQVHDALKVLIFFGCFSYNALAEPVVTNRLVNPSSLFNFENINMVDNQILSLAGKWCFNWSEFIDPETPCPATSQSMVLPSKWNNLTSGQTSFARQGYASYSTTIMLPKNAPPMGLYVPLFYRAGEFFINGRSVLKVGQVGETKDTEVPRDKRSIIALPEGVQRINLVIHVSSFHHIEGGLNNELQIAPLTVLLSEERIRSFSSIFLVGSSLSFAVYFFFIGLGPARRKDFVYIAGATSIFTYTLRIIGTEQIWLFIVPDMPAFWTLKFEYYGIVLGLPAYLYYLYYLFPDNVNKLLCRGLLLLGLMSFVAINVLPTEIYVWLRDPWIALFAFFMLYFLYCIVQAIKQRQPDSYIVGFIVITVILTISHDLFIWFGVFSGNRLVNLTYLSLLLGNAAILTTRMIRSANREVVLAKQINLLNLSLQNKVEKRTKQLAQKVNELDQQRHIAEKANSAKSKFLATASHDLRQPLHALGLFIGSLRFSRNNQEKAEIQDKLEATHSSLTELFDGLLDISKIDADAIDTEIQPVAVKPLLQKIQQEFEVSAINKGIQLRFHGKDLYVISDPLWLERIVRNLLSNALRYTNQGGVLLTVRLRKNKVLIQVWDTGIGIPKEQQSSIFEEFTQLKNPSPAGRLGLGLGLSIVQKLGVLLDHKVTVQSKVGQGSVFTVEAEMAEAISIVPSVSQISGGLNPLAGKIILVVDDEAPILDAMRLMLEKWDCTVFTANSMAEVKSVLESQVILPDMLITDYRFPGDYTGLDIIQFIRQSVNKHIPALMVTGDTSKDKVELFKYEGVKNAGVRVLHKPVQQAKIRLMLNHLSKELE